MAIGASSASAPADLLFALRGSGQALYVGLADDAFVVASEPYGLVEETDRYLRLDGETPADPDNPSATRGQIVRLSRRGGRHHRGHRAAGLRRCPPAGPRGRAGRRPQITTRDIDRGDSPHFLLKEITEAPASFRKTLRGKLVERDGVLQVVLPEDTFPSDLRGRSRRRAAATGHRHRPGHRGRGRPRAWWPRSSPRSATTARCGRGRCWPPSCPGSTSPPTCPTRW